MKMAESSPSREKSLWEKEELLVTKNFHLFPQCFQNDWYCRQVKTGLVWERINALMCVKSTDGNIYSEAFLLSVSLHNDTEYSEAFVKSVCIYHDIGNSEAFLKSVSIHHNTGYIVRNF